MGDYDRVFGTGLTIVQGGPIEFFVRGADEMYLDLNNSKREIKLKITLENINHLGGGDSLGFLNDILNALFMSVEMEVGGGSSLIQIQNIHIEQLSKILSSITSSLLILGFWLKVGKRILQATAK